jgi:hypothetical protein
MRKPVVSFEEKNGWKGILSTFEENPRGLDEPVS